MLQERGTRNQRSNPYRFFYEHACLTFKDLVVKDSLCPYVTILVVQVNSTVIDFAFYLEPLVSPFLSYYSQIPIAAMCIFVF